MCSIYGVLATGIYGDAVRRRLQNQMESMWIASHNRGRDGRGVHTYSDMRGAAGERRVSVVRAAQPIHIDVVPTVDAFDTWVSMIGNLRAEPTTEYVADKRPEDQQPYNLGAWNIVHNGTIANDKELRADEMSRLDTIIDSAAIVEQLHMASGNGLAPQQVFSQVIDKLVGSYAILAQHESAPDRILFACNYRPIWWGQSAEGLFITSNRESLPGACYKTEMVPPYSLGYFNADGAVILESLKPQGNDRALVVCSGGLDSVVTAAHMVNKLGASNVELIHFCYGSRAEGPEMEAVRLVAERLGVALTVKQLPVYSASDSNLLNPDADIAGGEQGAEFAHEWVPARNLLLIAVAVAYAEAKGFTVLCLGNNLEEAGAYPDNEPEFIARVGDLLPFAIGVNASLRIEQPVGNLMKHEIVARGLQLGAPLDVTWSCYRAGRVHCGKCGPCTMRRIAFQINDAVDPLEYEDAEG